MYTHKCKVTWKVFGRDELKDQFIVRKFLKPAIFFSFFKDLFLSFKDGRGERENLSSPDSLPNWLLQARPAAWNPTKLSLVGDRNPGILTISCCCPRCIHRKLDLKQSNQTSAGSHSRCWHSWQFYLLYLKAKSTFFFRKWYFSWNFFWITDHI